jgi:spore coat protein H
MRSIAVMSRGRLSGFEMKKWNAMKLLRVLATLFALVPFTCARGAKLSVEEDIFQSTNLLHIAIEIPDDGMRALSVRRRSDTQAKPTAQAMVSEGNHVFTNVTVQLKGYTTYQPIGRLPSLTLNFDKEAPKQKFHGLTKISLNNALQDASRLHEKLSREIFTAAGVPVPRADFAVVTLNGRELGLYVLAEGYDKDFLKRHFKRADGNFYEGGILRDIDQPLQLSPGLNPDRTDVHRLIAAAHESDPAQRWRALEANLDLDKFLSMMAVEALLCHSDSYTMNRNNYRLYRDPATDKFVFMPHGMDRVLGTHRSALDLSIMPPALGMVSRAVLSVPEGRRRYIERVGTLFTNIFDADQLCRRVHEMDAKIIGVKTNAPRDGRFFFGRSVDAAQDADDLCRRIAERATEVKFQLEESQTLLYPPPVPVFDTNGVAHIENWKTKRSPARPELRYQMTAGRNLLHLKSTNGPIAASLRSQITLPGGSYRLTGAVEISGATNGSGAVTLSLRRYVGTRFDVSETRLKGAALDFNFRVSEPRVPDEIEFTCEIRDESKEVWIDLNSMKLIDLSKTSAVNRQ